MNPQSVLEELEQLAAKVGIEVAYHHITGEGGGGGGLCKVRGRWRAIIERQTSTSEKVSLLANCLSRFDVDSYFISPAVRQLIEGNRRHAVGVQDGS